MLNSLSSKQNGGLRSADKTSTFYKAVMGETFTVTDYSGEYRGLVQSAALNAKVMEVGNGVAQITFNPKNY